MSGQLLLTIRKQTVEAVLSLLDKTNAKKQPSQLNDGESEKEAGTKSQVWDETMASAQRLSRRKPLHTDFDQQVQTSFTAFKGLGQKVV